MKNFLKTLASAVVLAVLMLGVAFIAAHFLRPYNRQVVGSVLTAIAGLSMVAPLFIMDREVKEWVEFTMLMIMAFVPIQIIMIAAFL
jgi:hypothetical protein